MSAFEELGAGVGSLSIGKMYSQQNFIHDSEDDDLMDIDTEDLYGEQAGLNPDSFDPLRETINTHFDGINSPENDDEGYHDIEGNSLFLFTLNPTVLGAKYALKPRKLLMPAPSQTDPAETEKNSNFPKAGQSDDHDYEFDTSFLTSLQKSSGSPVAFQRSLNWYNTPHERDHVSPRISIAEPKSPYYENMMNGSGHFPPFQGQKIVDSVQIHHHHYYPPQQESVLSYSRRNFDKSVDNPEYFGKKLGDHGTKDHRLTSVSRAERMAPISGTLQRIGGDHLKIIIKNMPHVRPCQMLPAPWDPHAVPAARMPYVLLSYLQLLINMVLSGYALYLAFAMIQAIKLDVKHKLKQESIELLVEIALCERAYMENQCAPETIVPALEKMCAHWEKCMQQDAFQIGNRSQVSARTIGMAFNSLVEPLSFKVLSVGAMAILVIFACNFAFGYIRAKTYYGDVAAARARESCRSRLVQAGLNPSSGSSFGVKQ